MDKRIEQLRNLNLDIEQLKLRKEEIKKKALEHRSTVTSAQADEAIAEVRGINEQIAELEQRREKIQNDNKNQGENRAMDNKTLHFKEGMERGDILSTTEYRSAFFKRLQGRELTEDEKRSMTSATNSGGAAIPTKTMDEIIGQFTESPTLIGLITVLNIPELLSLPKESVTNDASWIAEDSAGSVVDDSLSAITLSAYKLLRFVKVTAKLSAMSVSAFEAWVINTLVKKMRAAIENAIINGTGTNQPTGIDKTVWDATNSITVGAAAALSYDDFVDAEALVDEGYINSAVWVMNRKTLAAVKKLKDDQKRPLFERMVEDGFRGNIIGYPVRVSKYAADNDIYFGDWKSAYVFNFTKAVELRTSDEAGFMDGGTVYRALALCDGKPTGVAGAMVKITKATTGG